MKYNNKKQPYEIIGRFRVLEAGLGEVEYCRIKFATTGNVQVVTIDLEKEGDFEDVLLEEDVVVVSKKEEKPSPVVVQDDITSINVEPTATPEIKDAKIVATNPKGKDIVVDNLEEFVAKNNLELEVVQAVLEGKQKTHKKWRFKTV